jgi:hypothetical protein
MAMIHHTTLKPGKLDLIAPWLPAQPWYAGGDVELAKAGGFRLDDPTGEVGIEFMAVGAGSVTYHVPLTYRAAPLPEDDGLLGTSEHGVLGKRWIYDGVHDPVFVERLLALIQGEAEPQAQSVSHTPDHTVSSHFSGPDRLTAGSGTVRAGTEITVAGDAAVLHVVRVLQPGTEPEGVGQVTANWQLPDGMSQRGCFAFLRLAGA